MTFRELYKRLEESRYYVFSYEDLLSFYPGERKDNLGRMLSRWKKEGWICSLKRGLYELTYPRDFAVPDMYIANKLYSPSYVSLETALSYYSIIPEVSMAVTSVTVKPTRRFKNKYGLFIYRTVKAEFFRGYYVERQGNFDILIAEPEKALVDFLYFKSGRGSKKVSLEDERMDRRLLARLNRKKLTGYARACGLDLKKESHAYL